MFLFRHVTKSQIVGNENIRGYQMLARSWDAITRRHLSRATQEPRIMARRGRGGGLDLGPGTRQLRLTVSPRGMARVFCSWGCFSTCIIPVATGACPMATPVPARGICMGAVHMLRYRAFPRGQCGVDGHTIWGPENDLQGLVLMCKSKWVFPRPGGC